MGFGYTPRMTRRLMLVGAALAAAVSLSAQGQPPIIHVPLAYAAPGDGPKPNFSPKGTQVALADAAPSAPLPAGAVRPVKIGVMPIGPNRQAWIPVMATADADHPNDLCRLYLDRNRNGRFDDDGPALSAMPTQNDKTKAWWTSINKVELSIPYPGGAAQPYLVNVWIVRDDGQPAPDVLRYSVGSWRYGTATVNGQAALVAAMDSDNNAVFDAKDMWSVVGADEPKAANAVLTIDEARETSRMMFLHTADPKKDVVLEFRSFAPDGSAIDFAVVDRPVTKKEDRAGDDLYRDERTRPRATTPFTWGHAFDEAAAKAKSSNRRLMIDFEATWCGPCHAMDQWVWSDAEVAGVLSAGYVGVKLDADLEKALVKRFNVAGYPTMIVLDPSGKEVARVVGYQSSKDMLAFMAKK
jgi:thiol-disulfide isomerase/thioredoxin